MNQLPPEPALVVWPCYEPAGYSLELTAGDLLQHVLILGSTGCGKTTLLTGAIQQLIGHGFSLLILDAKVDGVVECIREATRCFEANTRPTFHPAEVANESKLCVVSVNALTHPELAKFLLRLARREFFDAVQARNPGPHPLCGLVADELPLIIQPEDADQLATLRSKLCFVLAATQGLAGLDDKIGVRRRQAVLLNFNTIIWMRTREVETGEFAALSLGQQEVRRPAKPETEWEDSVTTTLSEIGRSFGLALPVCPPGALGRLQPHQGYAVCTDAHLQQSNFQTSSFATCCKSRKWAVALHLALP
jgi:hypothetical protein